MRRFLGAVLAGIAMTTCTTACTTAAGAAKVSAETSEVADRAAPAGLERLLLTAPTPSPLPRPLRQLPRGGRRIFPTYLVVAHYGTAGPRRVGGLGEGTPQQGAPTLVRAAARFRVASGRGRPPAFHLSGTVAQ